MKKMSDVMEGNLSSDEEIDYKNSELVKCRYYRERVPAKDGLVAVVTTEIKDTGAYVRLLEYDNIEAFIMLGQVTAKRVKSVYKFLKIGKQEMMEVLRVDEDKMCIDLSKKIDQARRSRRGRKTLQKSEVGAHHYAPDCHQASDPRRTALRSLVLGPLFHIRPRL
jgi:predicted RNA-binding protein with RPS1 domain